MAYDIRQNLLQNEEEKKALLRTLQESQQIIDGLRQENSELRAELEANRENGTNDANLDLLRQDSEKRVLAMDEFAAQVLRK